MVTKQLIGKQHTQYGLAEQWTDSCPGKEEIEQPRFHHTAQHRVRFKTYQLFISGIFHVMFFG